MALPYFYIADLPTTGTITLDEDTSKHVVMVLRKKKGEHLLLTDGKGNKAEVQIINDHKKHCEVSIVAVATEIGLVPHLAIGISLVKNVARFEWFLEKATEIGINEIYPLVCERTEKEKFRHDRLQNIITSAMLQSQQSYMPVLHQPTPFNTVINESKYSRKLIAHCLPEEKNNINSLPANGKSSIILIGPEGDFTPAEIEAALQKDFKPVTLGATRLRTETAGMVAAALLRNQ